MDEEIGNKLDRIILLLESIRKHVKFVDDNTGNTTDALGDVNTNVKFVDVNTGNITDALADVNKNLGALVKKGD